MKYYLSGAAGIIMILLLLLSCNDVGRKYIIPEKKFVAFLVDLHLAEAIGAESKRDMDLIYKVDSSSLYGSVFQKHRITQAMFDSTLFFYSRRPERFQKIYNSVTAELKHMEDALTREKAEMEMANTRIIWQNDSVFVFPQQGADRIEINVPIPGPGTYAVSASVKMLPNDASLDPRMTVYFYRDNGTVPGDRIRFPDTRYTLRTGEPKIYRTERSLDSTNYTHIKGYIANYSNADTLFRRNMVVTSIKVTKKNSNR